LHKDAPVFRPIRQTAIIRSPDPWHVESNAWSAKPMVGVYPEWARRPADDLSSDLVDGFRHAGANVAKSLLAPERRSPDRTGEQVLSLADEVIE
jgi:hypothetical protein